MVYGRQAKSDCSLTINNYHPSIHCNRDHTISGGVACYIYTSVPFSVLTKLLENHVEWIWLKMQPKCLPRYINPIILAALYLPQNTNIEYDQMPQTYSIYLYSTLGKVYYSWMPVRIHHSRLCAPF